MIEYCPFKNCDGVIIPFPSTNKKICFGCHAEFEWKLKEGQKSTTISNYTGGRSDYGMSNG